MDERAAFGPYLRRVRLVRGISLDDVADATKVSVVLWEGLERSDLSRWPNGLFARAFIRDYAKMLGLDPQATVDEFCRLFPQGDRRAAAEFRAHAEIVGHQLEWTDEVPENVRDGDRRSSAETTAEVQPKTEPAVGLFDRLRRVLLRT